MRFLKFLILALASSFAFMGAATACDTKAAGSAPTLAQYQKIKVGMSVKEVQKILGSPGTEGSYNEIGGNKNLGMGWADGAGIYYVTGTFVNDKLVGKSQDGLK